MLPGISANRKRIEVVSLGGVVLGAIAAVMTSNQAFFSVPTAIALSVTTANRREETRRLTVNAESTERLLQDSENLQRENEARVRKELQGLLTERDSLAAELEKLDLDSIRNFEKRLASQDRKTACLVRGRSESRKLLEEALDDAQERVILICPWLGHYAIEGLEKKFQELIKRKVRVDIGWFKSSDLGRDEDPEELRNLLRRKSIFYDKFCFFDKLSREGKINLKCLGTHQKAIVCDRKFALIGSHNFLMSAGRGKKRGHTDYELGLQIFDPGLIQEIIEIYDNSPEYRKTNAVISIMRENASKTRNRTI